MNESSRMMLIGVAGASGSGKSFFAHALQQQLTCSSHILSQDDYYKDRSDISQQERECINYDHPDLCFVRRLQRDIKERGRSVDSVVSQYLATVRPMFLEFVQPTIEQADIVVKGIGDMVGDVEQVITTMTATTLS